MTRAKSKNPLLQTLLSMIDPDNSITVNRPIVLFLNSLEGAMLLSQLLYWYPRASLKGKWKGWIAKSDKEFRNELCLSRYSIRAARKLLRDRGIIKTDVGKFNGYPTVHYFMNLNELEKQWLDFIPRLSEIEQSIIRNRTIYGLSETEQSLTETTRDYPHNGKGNFKSWKDTPQAHHAYFQTCMAELGLPEPTTQKEIEAWMETFTEWMSKDYTPKQIPAAARFAHKRQTVVSRPASITYALSHLRRKPAQEKPPAQGESTLAKLAQNQRRK